MNVEKAIELAVRKTVDIFKDRGIKIRPKEISSQEGYYDKEFVASSWDRTWIPAPVRVLSHVTGEKAVKGVVVTITFVAFGERGKIMKREKNRFLDYFNARVYDDKIVFSYSVKELEVEDTSSEDISPDKIEGIMKKIEKLLALSESDNENESISASLMAQKLLKKYNIEIEQITGKEKKEEVTECKADVKSGNKWKYNLASVVAKNYCCKCYYVGSEQIVFYGYKSDTLIARRMFVYLFEVGCRLAGAYERNKKEELKEAYENGDIWSTSTAGVYNSFCVGFTDGISEQLGKQCTALMLVVPQEVEEQYAIKSEKFGKINSNVNLNDMYAYGEGKEEGKRALNSHYLGNENK